LNEEKKEVAWLEVERIEAYKIDLLAFDEVCLDIVLSTSVIRITEETEGWNTFIQKLQAQFPGIERDWYSKIIQTSFQTNHTVLYERS
ncbi:MAG: hypothetical protein JNM19_11495, partial [Chitinophagaceae bacterium]|nr:hypothetical protein [Chitinophagaceae bacterium]